MHLKPPKYATIPSILVFGGIMKHSPDLMGHIVAGYPNLELSFYAALGICKAGASYLEVQFPFSDPNADGPIIEKACNISIENGFKVKEGFELLCSLGAQVSTKLLIMTYANIIFSYGIEKFLQKAKKSGVWGIIVPDLPPEVDENLRILASKIQICVISLIAPKATQNRIHYLSKISDEIVYVVARSGTTGAKTKIDSELTKWISFVRANCKKPIALGFGINSNQQVYEISKTGEIEIIVAGSYFVQKITEISEQNIKPQNIEAELNAHTKALMGWT